MNLEESLARYFDSGEISPALQQWLRTPLNRRAVYFRLAGGPLAEYRQMLLHLLDLEISFRNALWEGTEDDADDCFEGIYQCAFLLGRCRDPSDTKALWKAQYLNQDIGELFVGYFVGAGIAETLHYLDQEADDVSMEIAEFIREALSEPEALQWISNWEERCASSLDNCR
jgi:hypothetical protein